MFVKCVFCGEPATLIGPVPLCQAHIEARDRNVKAAQVIEAISCHITHETALKLAYLADQIRLSSTVSWATAITVVARVYQAYHRVPKDIVELSVMDIELSLEPFTRRRRLEDAARNRI